MPTKIYVCYHENSIELARDCGAMSDLMVTSCLEDALRWLINSIETGEENEYCTLVDEEAFDGVKNLIKGKDLSLYLYNKGDENSDWNYEIVIKQFEYSKDTSIY